MSAAKVKPEDYIQFLIASPTQFSCVEAARVAPAEPDPPAHDAYNRLLTRLEPDPEALWQEARSQVAFADGVLVLDDSTLDKPYARSDSRDRRNPLQDNNFLKELVTSQKAWEKRRGRRAP